MRRDGEGVFVRPHPQRRQKPVRVRDGALAVVSPAALAVALRQPPGTRVLEEARKERDPVTRGVRRFLHRFPDERAPHESECVEQSENTMGRQLQGPCQ